MGAAASGRIEAKLHPGAALSQRDAGREYFALRDGAADLAVGSALAWSAQLPALAIYALPWIAPEPADLSALASSPEVAGELMKRAVADGVVLLAMAPLGHRSLATVGASCARRRTSRDCGFASPEVRSSSRRSPPWGRAPRR
jgi:TRAP-type C4-dicarboxylate transport system substrate-binding protein